LISCQSCSCLPTSTVTPLNTSEGDLPRLLRLSLFFLDFYFLLHVKAWSTFGRYCDCSNWIGCDSNCSRSCGVFACGHDHDEICGVCINTKSYRLRRDELDLDLSLEPLLYRDLLSGQLFFLNSVSIYQCPLPPHSRQTSSGCGPLGFLRCPAISTMILLYCKDSPSILVTAVSASSGFSYVLKLRHEYDKRVAIHDFDLANVAEGFEGLPEIILNHRTWVSFNVDLSLLSHNTV
jgi:hypothetical protein